MSMKIWDRLILLIGGLLTVAAGAVLFVQGLQTKNLLCAALGALAAVFGGYQLMLLRRCGAKRQEFVVQRTDSGELRIAVKAIENLVLKCADLHEEIHVNSMKILNGREGVAIDLNVTLANNISIPLAVAALQKQIKQYLVASTGIEVHEVRVSVESAQETPAPQEPEQAEEQPAEKAVAREEKVPLHQRLFCRADEPAIVPEPPKEEEAPAEAEEEAPAEQAEELNAEEAPKEEEAPAVEKEETPAEETDETPAEEAEVIPTEAAEEPAQEAPAPAVCPEALEEEAQGTEDAADAEDEPETEEKTHEQPQ